MADGFVRSGAAERLPLLAALAGPAGAVAGLGTALYMRGQRRNAEAEDADALAQRRGEIIGGARADMTRERLGKRMLALDSIGAAPSTALQTLYGAAPSQREVDTQAIAEQQRSIAADVTSQWADNLTTPGSVMSARPDQLQGLQVQLEADGLPVPSWLTTRLQQTEGLTPVINQLSDDAVRFVEPVRSAQTAVRNAIEAPADFAGDLALAYGLARLNNPTGTLTDSDLEQVAGSGALGETLQRVFGRLSSGAELTAGDRRTLRQQTIRQARALIDLNLTGLQPIIEQGQRLGVPRGMLFSEQLFRLPEGAEALLSQDAPPPGVAAPRPAQASGALSDQEKVVQDLRRIMGMGE